MYILGISAFYHDSAACLLKNGNIISAAQEERFTRKKHDPSFPSNAIRYCLDEAKIEPIQVSCVLFYEKPILKFDRLIETYLAFAPKGLKSFALFLPAWIKDKLFQKKTIIKELSETLCPKVDWNSKLFFSKHHLSHAASAFYPSPFDRAAILTLDGVGEWTTSSIAIGFGNKIKVVKEINFPHSLGLLYSAFTYHLGFKVNSGEYKLMGLAPYGSPKFKAHILDNLISISKDGGFKLNMEYFDFATGLKMTTAKFDKLFGCKPRSQNTPIAQKHMDIAASIQKVLEEIVCKIASGIARETGERKLCLAGGVALNCVVNGLLRKQNIFEDIWVQPASGDAGGALGAALCLWHLEFAGERACLTGKDSMAGGYLGPSFSSDYIEGVLKTLDAKFHKYTFEDLVEEVATYLTEGKTIGWMQGRMEFGPRALGNRSILADPRNPEMQKRLNMQIKYRESFRPFAPSVLEEKVQEWFETKHDSPYMLFVASVKNEKRVQITNGDKELFGIEKLKNPRSLVPAITHVDYSARIQTVNSETNAAFHRLISKFYQKTNCPMLVNTSFNVRGEPIVCTPTDAYRCFMETGLDILVIDNYLLYRSEQTQSNSENYVKAFELD